MAVQTLLPGLLNGPIRLKVNYFSKFYPAYFELFEHVSNFFRLFRTFCEHFRLFSIFFKFVELSSNISDFFRTFSTLSNFLGTSFKLFSRQTNRELIKKEDGLAPLIKLIATNHPDLLVNVRSFLCPTI